MRPTRLAILAALLLPATSGVAQVRTLPSDSAVLAIIKRRVDEKRSAGIVVGLLDADGKRRVVSYGDPGPGQPPLDGNSVFEIGSISKVFTATALASLVEDRQLRLDDPIQKYLPSTVKIPSRNGKQITFSTLAEQNSGLPRLPSNMHPADATNPYADYTVQQMYDFLSGYTLTRDPGTTFEYSNLGVGLLGHVLSLATGKSYEELERERVWKPLKMTNTAITLTPSMKEHLALGHDDQGKVVPNWDLPTLAGAGAIRSTANDMLKFLDANLHPERGKIEQAMALAQHERAPVSTTTMIGLNWMSLHAAGDTIVWHNGGTGGYRTFIGFEPSRKIGVVVLTNSGGAGVDDIGMRMLNPGLPLTPKPQSAKQRTAIDLPESTLAPYVGKYELGPDFIIDVTLADGALSVQATGQPKFRLYAETATDFFLKEVDAQISFARDASGAVSSLVLHQNGAHQIARKLK
jgi:serine-type D-Ala-D-Ala carboxypeptidase/endopeptidase